MAREEIEPTAESQSPSPAAAPAQAPSDDIWSKCPTCKEISFRKEVERNLNICPKCGHHFRLTVSQRLSITVDRGSWHEMFADLAIGDPLGFVDSKPYPKRMSQAREASGRNDAVVVGVGKNRGSSSRDRRDGLRIHGWQHGHRGG